MAPRVSWAVATQADRRKTKINDKKTFRFTFIPLTRPRDRPHAIGLLVSRVKQPGTGRKPDKVIWVNTN
jgi:hypothetical protein